MPARGRTHARHKADVVHSSADLVGAAVKDRARQHAGEGLLRGLAHAGEGLLGLAHAICRLIAVLAAAWQQVRRPSIKAQSFITGTLLPPAVHYSTGTLTGVYYGF